MNGQTLLLPAALQTKVDAALASWAKDDKVQRLWARDASVWTGSDEAKWLGWLDAGKLEVLPALQALQDEVKAAGFKYALLLGMGGSSLCPEVFTLTFGKQAGFPELLVLDSTDPVQVKALDDRVKLDQAIVIVASKSGTTLEPNIFHQYFYDRMVKTVGKEKAGSHFMAITDPGSKLEAVAKQDGFRHIFPGEPTIGGRYSALSNFGLVPAAVMGVDLKAFLTHTQEMVRACGAQVKAPENPGAVLGAVMGQACLAGHDKVTLIASPGIHDLGAWLEQLIAESTGKIGKGLVPVDREALAAPSVYGQDRLFAYLRLEGGVDAAQDAGVDALVKAGHPVVRIDVKDKLHIGQEFFRWEIATAVAGSLIGINPFNQPDVEASKLATKQLTSEFEKTGKLPVETPLASEGSLVLFTNEKNAAELTAGGKKSVAEILKAHLARLHAGDYFALLAYVPMNAATDGVLQKTRHRVRDAKHVATVGEFGPRFLHSTGQAYKGGPPSGVFLQVTCDDAVELPVPGAKYTFGIVKAAQAQGDLEVLFERGRRALRVHLKGNLESALGELDRAVQHAL